MTTETKTGPVGREAVQERGGFKARVVRSTVVNVTVSVLLKAAVLAQSIILARTFAPGDLGLLASALMTVSLVTLFGQLGSDQAIIRHRADADERPLLDTAFTLNLMVGVALFAVVFAGAPAIATLAGRPESADHLRLLGALVLGPAFTMPAALWTRHFRFGVAKIPQFADIAVFLGTTLGLERAGFGVASHGPCSDLDGAHEVEAGGDRLVQPARLGEDVLEALHVSRDGRVDGAPEEPRVDLDGGQGVAHLVRQSRRHLAERGQAVLEAGLLLEALDGGEVLEEHRHADDLAARVDDEGERVADRGPAFAPMPQLELGAVREGARLERVEEDAGHVRTGVEGLAARQADVGLR